MSLSLLSACFLAMTITVAVVVAEQLRRHVDVRAKGPVLAGFGLWMTYATVIGLSGFAGLKVPPGPLLLGLPAAILLTVGVIRNPSSARFATKVTLPVLTGLQVFRLFVELSFHELMGLKLIPAVMTFQGANLDILIGLSAPVVAVLAISKPKLTWLFRAWNVVGLLLVINAVVLGAVTFSGGRLGFSGTSVPNQAIGIFPFQFIPGFLAPLAIALHALSLKALKPQEQAH